MKIEALLAALALRFVEVGLKGSRIDQATTQLLFV